MEVFNPGGGVTTTTEWRYIKGLPSLGLGPLRLAPSLCLIGLDFPDWPYSGRWRWRFLHRVLPRYVILSGIIYGTTGSCMNVPRYVGAQVHRWAG